MRCPYQLNLLFFMILLHGSVLNLLKRSSFEIISCQLILNILLKSFLWKTSISFSSCLVNVQSSALYMKTLSMYTLTILTFVLRLVALFASILVNLEQVLVAKPFLLLLSSSVSSKLHKYLHFFQDVLSFLLMLYSSVFSLFKIRFLSDSFSNIQISTLVK